MYCIITKIKEASGIQRHQTTLYIIPFFVYLCTRDELTELIVIYFIPNLIRSVYVLF